MVKARSPIVVHHITGTMRSVDDAKLRQRHDSDSALVTRQMAFCALVNQYAQLVLNALRYAQRSDVVVALRANCQACGSVDDGLQAVQAAAGQAGESDVGVVQF